jgi:hypothetical protein
MWLLNTDDFASSASVAPQLIGAEYCIQRKAARHLRRVYGGQLHRAELGFGLTLIPGGIADAPPG